THRHWLAPGVVGSTTRAQRITANAARKRTEIQQSNGPAAPPRGAADSDQRQQQTDLLRCDGGRVSHDVAKQIINHSCVRAAGDAMWPGLSQTWRIGSE